MPELRYDGFISYSRHDRAVAARLQRLLETLKPAGVRPNLRVFLDTEELSASASLTGSIRDALVASEFLVVIATPHSAQSPWVREEIKIWNGLDRRDRLLFVLADGDPESILRAFGAGGQEPGTDLPLAADVRARSLRASLRRLEDEYLRIAARLFGVGFDDLRQRAVRLRLERQRRIIAALAVVIVVVLGAATAAVWQWQVALAERRHAENRLDEAVGVANQVLSETDRKLQGVSGAEAIRVSLVTDASEMLDRLAVAGSERSSLLETQVEGHLRRGVLAADERNHLQANRELGFAEQLITKIPTESRRARARTLVARTHGQILLARKAYADAERQLELAESFSRDWAIHGSNEADEERGGLLRLMGDTRALQRRWAEAAKYYEEAAAAYRRLRARDQTSASFQLGAAIVEERLSRVAEVRRDASQVVRRMTAAIQLIEQIPQQNLAPEHLVQLAEAYTRLSELCKRWKRADLASSFDKKALDVTFGLYMTAPQNARYRAGLAEAWGRLGEDSREQKDFSRAKTLFALQTYMSEILLRQDPRNVALRQGEIEARAALIEMLVEHGERSAAEQNLREMRRKVEDFARSFSTAPSKEEAGAIVQAYCVLGEAARQLEMRDLREQSYRSAYDLAKARYDGHANDFDARMDLFVTTANMILIAAANNHPSEMRQHAMALSTLLPDEDSLDAKERKMVEDIRKLARQVLGRE